MTLMERRRALMSKGKEDNDMPKLIASATLEEASNRIDVVIPEEYRSADVFMVIVNWSASGSSIPYFCPEANEGTAKIYDMAYSKNINYRTVFFCSRNIRSSPSETGYKIGVNNNGATPVSGTITSLGAMQYYSDANFNAGSSIEVYSLNTEVPA